MHNMQMPRAYTARENRTRVQKMHIMHLVSAFYAYHDTCGMDLEDVQRKVQFRQGSYTVTIPLQIIHALGIRKNQYVRFAVSNKKVIIIKPVESTITKKDITEAEKDSVALDKYDRPQMMAKYEEEGGENMEYMDEIADIISRDKSDSSSSSSSSNGSRMEKLRMK